MDSVLSMASQKPTLHFALALHLQLCSVSVHLCFQSSSKSRPATRSFVTQAAVPESTVIRGGELERPDINVAKVVRVMVAISQGLRKAFFFLESDSKSGQTANPQISKTQSLVRP